MAQHTRVSADTTPYWSSSASLPPFARLESDLRVDVVVVGAGLTGLTAAYLLTQAGKRVAVLERDRSAQVDTGHTTAHLTMVTDSRLSDLVKRFGRDHAQAAWDAGLAAIDQIDSIIRREAIECEFEWVDGYLYEAPGEADASEPARLEEEAALARDLGFDATFMAEVPWIARPGIRFDRQARFHPRRYLAGVANAIRNAGGYVYEQSAAEEFVADPLQVKANGHTLTCRDIILATHNPLVGVSGLVGATLSQTKLALYTSYVVCGRVPRGTVPDALFWDTADPYHYLRVERQPDHDVIIFGGEDHKTGQADRTVGCYDRLAETLTSLVPDIAITHRWSGQVIETPDGLPYLGRTADHQYAATGFAGNGMTFGTLGAMIACDGILGRRNPWTDLFDPGRSAIRRGPWEYMKENADYPYYLIRDRFAGTDSRDLRSIPRGQGRIVSYKGKTAAAYRDDTGSLTIRSATCTHMACLVRWNDAERTWDCPCHGSRFKPDGEVLAGPAESPLPPIE